MNKNITILICCICILFTAFSCERLELRDITVKIENKTNDTIFFAHNGFKLKAKYFFVHKQLYGVDMVLPNSFIVAKIPYGYTTTHLTFISQTVLNKYTEQEIIDKEMVVCYAYSRSTMLESNDFKIVYTGEPQDSINIIEEQYEK